MLNTIYKKILGQEQQDMWHINFINTFTFKTYHVFPSFQKPPQQLHMQNKDNAADLTKEETILLLDRFVTFSLLLISSVLLKNAI